MNQRYENLKNEQQNLSLPYTEKVDIPKDIKAKETTKDGKGRLPEGKGTRSLFNRYSIFYLNEGPLGSGDKEGELNPQSMNYGENSENWRKTHANSLILGSTRNFNSGVQNLSTQNLINICSDGNHNAMDYEWSDFLYTQNNEIIPNNRLITLRRFPYPVGDNLLSKISCPAPDIARAVTWMDEESNKLEELLAFSYGFNWRKLESELDKYKNPTWGREADMLGGNKNLFFGGISEIMNGETEKIRKYDTKQLADFDPLAGASNLVLGPLDVIKEMMVRDRGLEFSQEIKLTFDYDLKSYDGIDPRVAFVDLMSNLLVMTFNRGEFWGGDVRFYGGRQRRSVIGDKAFEDLANGDFSKAFGNVFGANGSIIQKFKTLIGNATSLKDSFANFGKNILSGVGNLLIGSGLDKMQRPEMLALQALLTGEPTGMWHVTIGNPLAPIMSCGNMILDKSELKFHGPMGHHDFPTKMTLECTLKHGRPRDRSDIMSMFAPQVGRTYYTEPPQSLISAMNRKKGNYGTAKTNSVEKQNQKSFDAQFKARQEELKNTNRFPNHLQKSNSLNNETIQDRRIAWAAQWTT